MRDEREKPSRDKKHDGMKPQTSRHRSNKKTPPRFENFDGEPIE